MKRSFLWIIALCLLIASAVLVSIAFVAKRYDFTALEAVNKLSEKAGLVEKNELLLSYSAKYSKDYLNSFWENPASSKLLSYIGVDGAKDGTPLRYRYNKSIENRYWQLDCQQPQINYKSAVYCFYDGKITRHALLKMLGDFVLLEPKEVGTYGNAWEYVLFYEAVKLTTELSPQEEEKVQESQIDATKNTSGPKQ